MGAALAFGPFACSPKATAGPGLAAAESQEAQAQLRELESVGWLSFEERAVLTETMSRLRDNRMLGLLLPDGARATVDTAAAARIFRERLGDPGPTGAPAV